MDIRQEAIDILIKAHDGEDVKKLISAAVSQLANIEDRILLKSIVESGLEKSKYAGRDYGSAQDIANNAKRKQNNMSGGQQTGLSSMPHVKEWGGSGVDAASRDAKKYKKMSAKNTTNKIDPKSGKVVDVLHSSGRKKGKSVFSSDGERAAHIASLEKRMDDLQAILEKARSRIGYGPIKAPTLPSEKDGIDFNTIKGVHELTDHTHEKGAMADDHPDRPKVVDYITHLHRNGKGAEALRLYENHIKGEAGTYTKGFKKSDDFEEFLKISENMNTIEGREDEVSSPHSPSEKVNRIGGREDVINKK